MKIKFNFNINTTLRDRIKLKNFLCLLAKSEKTQFESLNFIFCSNDFLLEINKSFLNHDYYTDIITFDLSDSKTKVKTGEIYISSEMVLSNSKDFETTYKEELHRVIFHGVLHLCGYKDKSEKERVTMRKKEDHYLNLYFN